MTPAPVTVIKANPPCNLPGWPTPIALGGVKIANGAKVVDDATKPGWIVPDASVLVTRDGLAEIARYVSATTAYFDASRLCWGGK